MPYAKYNTIIIGIVVSTAVIFILLFIIFKKHKKIILVLLLIIIILEGIGAYFIIQEGIRNSKTKTTLTSESTTLID